MVEGPHTVLHARSAASDADDDAEEWLKNQEWPKAHACGLTLEQIHGGNTRPQGPAASDSAMAATSRSTDQEPIEIRDTG